jgi:DNA-binding response OmpR family regulator
LGLPKKDGFQVAEELAAALPRTSLLIAVTGYGSREVEDRGRKAGFRHILVKPADPLEVERLLREHGERLAARADCLASQGFK